MTILLDESFDDYRSSGSFGIHALRDYERRGPGYFYHCHLGDGIERGRRKAFDFGTAFHTMVLEGEVAYGRQVVVKPETYTGETVDKDRKAQLTAEADAAWKAACEQATAEGKKKPLKREFAVDPSLYTEVCEKAWNGNANSCKEWEAKHEGDNIISVSDDRCIRAMHQSLRENEDCMRYLSSGIPEVVVRSEEQGLPIQMRADWISGNGPDPFGWDALCDIKTCDSLTDFWKPAYLYEDRLRGGGDVVRYGYHRQGAWYQWMLEQETGVHLPFVLIAVEKAPPHRCGVYVLCDDLLEIAYRRNEWLLEAVANHYESNVWPRGNPEGEQMCRLEES